MENVKGILLGNAYQYVERIYKEFYDAGYYLHHWLLKGEQMGVPQARHRVFFIGIRKDLDVNPSLLNMDFNYKPITYGEIKAGVGRPINQNTEAYQILLKATHQDLRISDTLVRLGERERRFGEKIAWEENVLQTIPANLEYYRGEEKTWISTEDVIHAQTFPEDYKFCDDSFNKVAYICGMSVPPVMIKRIVNKLIEQNVFEERRTE